MLKNLFGQLLRRRAAGKDDLVVHHALAAAELTGEHYLALLARLHAYLQPRTYMEIGVSTGNSLRLAGAYTRALGIDPHPCVEYPLGKGTKIFAETSDEFFARRDLRQELGGCALELAFIDGMHRFEFVLRDFINLEPHCSRNGAILLHDGYPLDATTSSRTRATKFFSGDTWRALLALKKYRPDLRIATLAAPPTGLTVVRALDPGSRVLAQHYDEIVADLMSVEYAELEQRKAEMLNLVPGDWETARGLFSAT
jgi:hypothetical protein